MMRPAKVTPFRLSRIYAQGWNAARLDWRAAGAPVDPYVAEPERSRWQAGFSGSQADSKRTPDESSSYHGHARPCSSGWLRP